MQIVEKFLQPTMPKNFHWFNRACQVSTGRWLGDFHRREDRFLANYSLWLSKG